MDRIEYLMRLTHDHCDDGDALAKRQMSERIAHVQRTEELLALARGLVELLENEMRRYGPSLMPATQQVEQQRPPQRIAPIRKPEAANG